MTVGAPLDEIALELPQRGLQLDIGEFGADTCLEMHGCDLHGELVYRADLSATGAAPPPAGPINGALESVTE